MEKSTRFTVFQSLIAAAGTLAFLFTLIYGKAGLGTILLCIVPALVLEYLFAFRKTNFFNPYTAMLPSPLLLMHYSSITDFRLRALGFSLLIYIINIAFSPGARPIRFSRVFSRPLTIFLTAFLIFALAAVVLWLHSIYLSGDEPHYIMISQSLVNDGDFDLKNNYLDKNYLEYIPVELRFHGDIHEGKYLSFHLPGLSFLLIPFYWLFKLSGGAIPPALFFRLAAAFINAFFALGLFYLLKRLFPDKETGGLWLLFLVLFPLSFHAAHLYPELPAASLMMAAFYFTGFEKKKYLLAGLFLSLVPWFHIKYIPPLLVLAGAILFNLLKPFKPFSLDKEKLKNLARFFAFPVMSVILLLVYSKVLYGSFSPTAIFPPENFSAVPWLLRLKVFLAYFLDQRDGLLFYSPIFFLFFFSFKEKLTHKGLLLGMAFAYVFFHAYTTVRGAHAPAGRPLVFIIWIFIVFIVHWYFNVLKPGSLSFSSFSFRFLAGMGFSVLVWLFYYPWFIYQPVYAETVERASGFNLFWGSNFMEFWKFFPSFLTNPPGPHPANIVWLILLAAALLFYYVRPLAKTIILPRPSRPFTDFIAPVLLFLLLSYIFCFFPHVHLVSQNKYTGKTLSFYNNSRNFLYIPEENGFRIKPGYDYDIFIDRKLVREDDVVFHFSSTDAVEVTIFGGKRLLFSTASGGQKEFSCTIPVSSLAALVVKNKTVSHLGIETRTVRPVSDETFLWLRIE